ncbi:MAG: endonuclease/exonuclease/phosphatase family protein [Bacteroidales bacterium]|nr:endonuclease/exonuclease/phosphatase family protein [Bacteroidales bacterium]
MKKIIVLLIICLSPILIFSQNNNSNSIVAFYNVENLFDTFNDPITKDDEFTPESEKRWTNIRYQKKINDIAKVISSLNNADLPVLVGFAEVENKLVLEDLIKTNFLKDGDYKIVHEESPDIRGIDVALIYKTANFKYLTHKKIPIPLNTKYKVRDILYTKGILNETDTLHVFVNHWKSRVGGQEKSESQRIKCAQILRNSVDSILAINKNEKILIMGDLNDEPLNKSVFKTLKANNSGKPKSLNNLMLSLSKNGFGTYNYRGNWSVLDHIIVSNNLTNNNSGLYVKENTGHIFSADWITFTYKDGNKTPNRTYGGPNYYGGYSDHYPVYIVLARKR